MAFSKKVMDKSVLVSTPKTDPNEYSYFDEVFKGTEITDICPFGGQHWYKAIARLVEEERKAQKDRTTKKAQAALEKEVELGEERIREALTAEEKADMKGVLVKRRQALDVFLREREESERIVEDGGWWLLVIYDAGE